MPISPSTPPPLDAKSLYAAPEGNAPAAAGAQAQAAPASPMMEALASRNLLVAPPPGGAVNLQAFPEGQNLSQPQNLAQRDLQSSYQSLSTLASGARPALDQPQNLSGQQRNVPAQPQQNIPAQPQNNPVPRQNVPAPPPNNPTRQQNLPAQPQNNPTSERNVPAQPQNIPAQQSLSKDESAFTHANPEAANQAKPQQTEQKSTSQSAKSGVLEEETSDAKESFDTKSTNPQTNLQRSGQNTQSKDVAVGKQTANQSSAEEGESAGNFGQAKAFQKGNLSSPVQSAKNAKSSETEQESSPISKQNRSSTNSSESEISTGTQQRLNQQRAAEGKKIFGKETEESEIVPPNAKANPKDRTEQRTGIPISKKSLEEKESDIETTVPDEIVVNSELATSDSTADFFNFIQIKICPSKLAMFKEALDKATSLSETVRQNTNFEIWQSTEDPSLFTIYQAQKMNGPAGDPFATEKMQQLLFGTKQLNETGFPIQICYKNLI